MIGPHDDPERAMDAAPPGARRPPRPWLAALLSLLQPGLGHAYLWRLPEALAFWTVFFAINALALLGFVALQDVHVHIGVLAAFLAGTLVYTVAVAARAWRTARAGPLAHRPRRGPLALVLLAWFAALAMPQYFLQEWAKRNFVEAFHIPSGAMEPTVLVGDYLFVKARRGAPIERGSLHTFRREGSVVLMRVVGLGGDTLAMRDGVLLRDGRPVEEPYARSEGEAIRYAEFDWQRSHLLDPSLAGSYVPTTDDWGPLVVPPDSVFVLGDNRHSALDSRFTGPVAEEDVLGYPTQVYFSRGPEDGIRWGRIGLRLDR